MKEFRHLYLHLPFCKHKCGYCDFNAYAGMDGLMPAYVDALLAELDAARAAHRFGALRTVYLGGGTPSLLPARLMAALLAGIGARFTVEVDAEVTLEANPVSTDAERLAAWRAGGVNRLSLGVQGFDPRALGVLERRTDGAQAERAFGQARAAGFDNVSLDLIYGIPGQPPALWRETVRRAAALEPEHLSCYCLTFEAGTLLTRRRDRGLLAEVEDDDQADQLDIADEELDVRGYTRYELLGMPAGLRRGRRRTLLRHRRRPRLAVVERGPAPRVHRARRRAAPGRRGARPPASAVRAPDVGAPHDRRPGAPGGLRQRARRARGSGPADPARGPGRPHPARPRPAQPGRDRGTLAGTLTSRVLTVTPTLPSP